MKNLIFCRVLLIVVTTFFYGYSLNTQAQTNLKLIKSYKDIPGIRDQSTKNGKKITSLYPFEHKIYIGYGDGAKSGGMEEAVDILYYDIEQDSFFTPFKTSSRNINQFQPYQNHLFVPNQDPVGHYGGLFRYSKKHDTWDSTSYIPGALHVFGLQEFNDKLFVCSSGFDTSLVASSVDLGETWNIEHLTKLNIIDSNTFSYARYYFIKASKDYLYTMSMKHFYNVKTQQRIKSQTLVYMFKNDLWSTIGVERDWFYSPILLNDSLVTYAYPIGSKEKSHKNFAVVKNDSLIMVKNFLPNGWGLKHSYVEKNENKSEQLWTIMSTSDTSTAIVTTKNFKDWSIVYAFQNNNFTSIAVCNNKIYLGTSDGQLYCYDR